MKAGDEGERQNVIYSLDYSKCRYIGINTQADTIIQSFRYSHGIPMKK